MHVIEKVSCAPSLFGEKPSGMKTTHVSHTSTVINKLVDEVQPFESDVVTE